jgi:histone-lysine N-methyltransferase SETD3
MKVKSFGPSGKGLGIEFDSGKLLEELKQSYNSNFNKDFELLKKIYPMIKQLRTTEPSDTRNENDMAAFIQWLKDNQVDFNFELAKTNHKGYGLIAIHPIKKHDLILKISSKLMLTSQIDSKELFKFKNFPQLILILKLIKEINSKNSFWKQYLNILPKPHEFTKLTLDEIVKRKGLSICHDSIKELFLRVKQFDIVSKFTMVDFNTFEWARDIVISRQNPIVLIPRHLHDLESDSQNHTDSDSYDLKHTEYDSHDLEQSEHYDMEPEPHLALIPLYDMINHQPGELTGSYDVSQNSATLYSGFDFQPGQEIKMSYGNRSNQDLFMYCNFVDPDNCDADNLKVYVTITRTDDLYKQRLEVLEMFGMKEGYFGLGSPLMVKSGRLMAFLYTLYLEKNVLLDALEDIALDFNNVFGFN